MKHKHPTWMFWWHDKCPPCKLRQMRYGFRLDPIGYTMAMEDIRNSAQWTYIERRWMLQQLGDK